MVRWPEPAPASPIWRAGGLTQRERTGSLSRDRQTPSLKKAAGWLVQHQRNRKAMKAKNPRGVPTRYTFRMKPAAEVLLPISEKRQSSQKYQSIRQANTLAAQE
jgi:hypothetical protein